MKTVVCALVFCSEFLKKSQPCHERDEQQKQELLPAADDKTTLQGEHRSKNNPVTAPRRICSVENSWKKSSGNTGIFKLHS